MLNGDDIAVDRTALHEQETRLRAELSGRAKDAHREAVRDLLGTLASH